MLVIGFRAHPHNFKIMKLIITAKTLSPNKVMFTHCGILQEYIIFWGSQSTHYARDRRKKMEKKLIEGVFFWRFVHFPKAETPPLHPPHKKPGGKNNLSSMEESAFGSFYLKSFIESLLS